MHSFGHKQKILLKVDAKKSARVKRYEQLELVMLKYLNMISASASSQDYFIARRFFKPSNDAATAYTYM